MKNAEQKDKTHPFLDGLDEDECLLLQIGVDYSQFKFD